MFKVKPIVVANEGLLPYLNFEEKTALAKNIHQLLERFGGVWITPDISTRDRALLYKERTIKRAAGIERITGIDIIKNSFESREAAQSFFSNLGFTVEMRSFREIAAELVLPHELKIPIEQVDKILEQRVAFVMKANAATLLNNKHQGIGFSHD